MAEELNRENTEEKAEESAIEPAQEDNGPSPEGAPIFETDVNITSSVLYDYLIRHMYNSPMGILATCLGVFMIIVYFMKAPGILYLICGIIIIIYSPISLFFMAKRQALSENFKKPLHYSFYENGMEISQDDNNAFIPWENTLKAVATSKSIMIYTGTNAASLFPRADLGSETGTLIKIIYGHMDPKKVRIKQ